MEFDEIEKTNDDSQKDKKLFDGNFEGGQLSEPAKRFLNGEITKEEAIKERMKELGLD